MMFSRIFDSGPVDLRARIIAIVALLAGFNLFAWGWALIAFHDRPSLLGAAFLAYAFGLRHAVDPDHIAAIDNITRKLMQQGRRPVTVGFFFSLGHSTVVMLIAAAVAVTAHALQGRFADFRAIGGIVSTLVSASFLFVIAGINMTVMVASWRGLRRLRRGGTVAAEDMDMLMAGGGLMARIFRRLFRLVERNRQIYLLGLLFGLGFDTATEISLLAMSANGVSDGISPLTIMIFPVLFSAGMALVDTADGILMLGAYGWAFVRPERKLYYNLAITSLSVLVAIVIGGIEVLGLLEAKLGLAGAFWDLIAWMNGHFDLLGYAIIGLFAAGWAVSLLIYRWRSDGGDEPAARPSATAPVPAPATMAEGDG